MPLEYTYSFLILLQILPKGHDGESSPARCAPENACHRLRARPAPPPDEVPSRAALLNPPPAPGPSVRCAGPCGVPAPAVCRPLCGVPAPVRCAGPPRQAPCAVRQAPLCGVPASVRCARPLCGAPGPSVRCAETRRSRLAALRRNEICMRGIPVQNKGGTASFASPLFGGGGAFLFVFARTRRPLPAAGAFPGFKSLSLRARARRPRNPFLRMRAARPSLPGSASTLRPPCADGQASPRVKQRTPPARMTRRSALYTGTHNTSIHIHTQQPAHTTHPHTHFLF